MTYKVLLTFSLILFATVCFAQRPEKCATVAYDKMLKNKLIFKQSPKEFENWVQSKITKKLALQSSFRTQEITYVIPIVIHIIHNGEAIGQGPNISLAQIDSQLKIFNDDFRKKNADTTKIPALFKNLASDANIEFKLAAQDPDGAPTTGIVRVDGKRPMWYFEDGDLMKQLSYWPSDSYLNIWVANLGNNTIGYAQFPTSDNLPGLEEGSNISETDGVVISYRYFGKGGGASNNSQGRTVTHEVGHFFGLKHIWGDDSGGCDGEDYVSDTPNQADAHNSCPGFPSSSCGNTSDMFMNYLDYSPDTCMNMFTHGQKIRMRTIIENSPRRKSLLSSKALAAPTILARDAAIIKIKSPGVSTCNNVISPSFLLRNLGTNPLTSITIGYAINNNAFAYFTKSLNLASYDTTPIAIPSITLSSGHGQYILKLEVKDPNGSTDERAGNNTFNYSFYLSPLVNLPFTENFSGANLFTVRNPDNGKYWSVKDAPGNGSSNKAAFMDLYSNQQIINEKDYWISPSFSAKGLTDLDSLGLSFKYAYAPKDNNSNDALIIIISSDCGATFPLESQIYYNSGSSLATAPTTTAAFTPSSPTHWREECLNLANFKSYDNLQIAFIANSGQGNNLYLDDIQVRYTTCNGSYPVAIEEEIDSKTSLNVYPNPNDGQFFIDLNLSSVQDLDITVFDLTGRKVYQERLNQSKSLHQSMAVGYLSDGVYLIKIQSKKINLSKKIMVKK